MKIFAKRTKKSSAKNNNSATTTTTTDDSSSSNNTKKKKNDPSEGDRAVLELLKLDPSKLNAKQRRMIKRFQERKPDPEEEENEKSPAKDNNVESGGIESEQNKNDVKKMKNKADNKPDDDKPDDDNDDNGSSSASSSHSGDGDNEEKQQDSDKENGKKEKEDHTTIAIEKDSNEKENTDATKPSEKSNNGGKQKQPEEEEMVAMETTETDVEQSDKGKKENSEKQEPCNSMEEVKKLLETLNSKQRRKLARQLEREGESALQQINEEALKLLKENEELQAKKKAEENSDNSKPVGLPTSSQPTDGTNKRKRKQADWSALSPEERLRREDQKRKQKEAAERRAQVTDTHSKHKHPLNSERRRANRRKPKWSRQKVEQQHKGGYQGEVGNNHDISGFHMRKVIKKNVLE